MEFEWDEDKNLSNLQKHGLRFEDAAILDWSAAQMRLDLRRPYGEVRFLARAFDGNGNGYFVALTVRGAKLRIISFRRLGKKEY